MSMYIACSNGTGEMMLWYRMKLKYKKTDSDQGIACTRVDL